MSGICDTCRREPCHMRFDGCKTCDIYEGGETRWHELFGTPERAALTLFAMCHGMRDCGFCPIGGSCTSCDGAETIREWLRGDADA